MLCMHGIIEDECKECAETVYFNDEHGKKHPSELWRLSSKEKLSSKDLDDLFLKDEYMFID